MTLASDKNVPLGDQIFGQIAAQIITGEILPGDKLPPERAMAELFGVNRHVVREAIKRGQQAGLLAVTHGGGITVLDISEHAGLDLLELLATNIQFGDRIWPLWRSVLEMRILIHGAIAGRCAERADESIKHRIAELVELTKNAKDDQAMFAAIEMFWQLLAVGSDNLAYQLTMNSLLRVGRAERDVVAAWTSREAREAQFYEPLAAAIIAGDSEQASACAIELTQRSLDELTEIYRAAPPEEQSSMPSLKKRVIS